MSLLSTAAVLLLLLSVSLSSHAWTPGEWARDIDQRLARHVDVAYNSWKYLNAVNDMPPTYNILSAFGLPQTMPDVVSVSDIENQRGALRQAEQDLHNALGRRANENEQKRISMFDFMG